MQLSRCGAYMAVLWERTVFSLSSKSWKTSGLSTLRASAGALVGLRRGTDLGGGGGQKTYGCCRPSSRPGERR